MSKYFLFFLGWAFLSSCIGIPSVDSDSQPIDHSAWNELLKKHVDNEGLVNYQGFIKDKGVFQSYLDLLSQNHPNSSNWSKDEQLAYWINAYNAFTIKLIIDYYPVQSIKDIAGSIPFVNSPWDVKFIEIEGETYDLNNIEHGIIRKQFQEPRIHFALVCAAVSCPKLRNEAYVAERLDDQLEDQAIGFFNNPAKNKIESNRAEVSKLLSWYGGDFKIGNQTKIDYINRYSKVKLNDEAKLDFMDYDWNLNEQ